MKVKVLKTIVSNGEVYKIGSEADLSEDTVKAFGQDYVEILGSVEPEKAEASETEPEAKTEETENAEPEKAERKKGKKK